MAKPPKKWDPEFKLKIVLEAMKGDRTIIEIASQHDVNPKQIQRWKNQLLEEGASLFVHKKIQSSEDPDKQKLLHIIEQLTLELDFIKKKLKGSL